MYAPNVSSFNPSSFQPTKNLEKLSPATRTVRPGLPYSSASHHNRAQNNTTAPLINSKPSRSLITVIPPSSLPSNPPQVCSSSSCSGYGGPPSAFSRGILIPLYPTLAAQMAAIAREYGLPSTGGMLVYMVEASPTVGELAKHLVGGPKISEAAWHILWSGVFEEEEADAFERELLERENQLYSEPVHRHCDEYHEDIEEEALNSSLEDLGSSSMEFPIPPVHNRPFIPTHGSTHQYDSPSSRPAQTSSISSSEDSKLSCTIDRRYPLGHKTDDRFKLGNRLAHHARSQSSCISNKINPTGSSHPSGVEMPPRPSSSLSTQLPSPAGRRISSMRHPIHPPPLSDRGSSYSTSSYRPRRIGAGMIVGKIEFDIDSSRSTGRWYEQWVNPSRLARNNPSSTTPVSADIARPLLLPNLITQRRQSSTSANVPAKQSPSSPLNLSSSSRSAGLASSKSSLRTDNSHSFLAFDDPSPPSSADLGRIQALDFPAENKDRPIEFAYRSCNKSSSGNYPLGSGRIFPTNRVEAGDDCGPNHGEEAAPTSPEGANGKRKLGGRLINDKHLQAISLMEAHAKHQALVDQIDVQLSSPIKLDPVLHHAFSFGNLTTTFPGLSLQVTGRPELAGPRCKQNEDGSGSSCTSSPETDPANMTHSSTGSSSNSSVDVSDNQGLLLPGLWSSKRSSSIAIEANLKELEQALASLSPRALRGGSYVLPSSTPLSASNLLPAQQQNLDGLCTSSSPAYLRESVTGSLSNLVDEHRGGVTKFLDSLQESYQDMKTRTSFSAPQPTSCEVPVGYTDGYSREDLREGHAPTSPQRVSVIPGAIRQNSGKHPSPRSSSFLRRKNSIAAPHTPTGAFAADGFVSKAAGIVAGKFRSGGSTPRRKSSIVDSA